jgi:hypothetical protein
MNLSETASMFAIVKESLSLAAPKTTLVGATFLSFYFLAFLLIQNKHLHH